MAGGWHEQPGWYRDDTAWWSNTLSQSWAWINAHAWLTFVLKQGRGQVVDDVGDLLPGDVLLADLDHDGTIDHSMLVTSKDSAGAIYLTYHNSDTRDRPFWDIYHSAPHALWYGVHVTASAS